MRSRIVCDSSSLISLSMNCMIPLVVELSESADFIITKTVYDEIITNPKRGGHHIMGPLQFSALIKDGVLTVEKADNEKVDEILEISNSTFFSHHAPLQIIQRGEAEALALADDNGVLLVDERTLRFLIESPKQLRDLLEFRMHRNISLDMGKVQAFRRVAGDARIIRSSEIVAVAYEKGILQKYFSGSSHEVLSACLWSLKSRGCSLSTEDVEEYLRMLR